ncbi:hypothetical protein E2C01_098880 [Portunus trituberculatus]|uniref:Uncharacterized protein n=1 Tax=Portunus trituberculatus TaxID=210409 RepID=A0A5B7K9D3_PORTR|nr:hypothetical protein [Portunus trituberculatus]
MGHIVKENVGEQLVNLTSERKVSIKGAKTVKEVAAAIMPGIASIKSVPVTTAVLTVVKDICRQVTAHFC